MSHLIHHPFLESLPTEEKEGSSHLPQIRPLTPSLSVNLKAMAWIVFILIGGLLPFLYIKSMAMDTQSQALSKAKILATRFTYHARQSPQLWAYQTHRLREEIDTQIGKTGWVQLDLPTHENFLNTSSPSPIPLTLFKGSAVIQLQDRPIGLIHVWIQSPFSSQSQFWIWMIAFFLAATLALSLYLIPIRTLRRGDQLNARYWKEIQELNQNLEERVRQRTEILEFLNRRILQIQEDERARISRNLHDDLGQVLTGLRIQLTTLELLGAPPLIKECLKTIDVGVDQLRTIAYDLRPPELDALGLQVALKRLLERRAQEGSLQVSFNFTLEQDPPSAQSEIFFRVAQEGMTNILRHAQASRVHIDLEQTQDQYDLKIYDDGIGLPNQFSTQHFGIGLLGAQARVKEKGGSLSLMQVSEHDSLLLDSSPSGSWTTLLSLSLPCNLDYLDLIGSPLPR